MKSISAAVAVAIFAIVGLVSPANAADYPVPVRVEFLKFGGWPPVGKLYKLVSRPYAGGPSFRFPSSSPAITGGTLTVVMTDGSLRCDLQAGVWNGSRGWKALGNPPGFKGYKYLNKGAPYGDPCKSVIVMQGMIKVFAKGTGTISRPLGHPPGNPDISTVLTIGEESYCAYAEAPHYRESAGRLIKARSQPAPDSCPLPDLSGEWRLTQISVDGDCPEGISPPLFEGLLSIQQNETALTALGSQASYSGSVSRTGFSLFDADMPKYVPCPSGFYDAFLNIAGTLPAQSGLISMTQSWELMPPIVLPECPKCSVRSTGTMARY